MIMTSKRARKSRIGLAFAGITAGMLALFAPVAEATSTHPAGTGGYTVHVNAGPAPTKAMRTALRVCAPAPKNLRQLCHSLALRPALGDTPAGLPVVRECFTEARSEGKRYGAAHGRAYLKGCLESSVLNP